MPRLTVHIPMRWSDIDGYGHVNNAKALTLLEEARIVAFWGKGDSTQHGEAFGERQDEIPALLEGGTGAETNTLIVRQVVEYLKPLPYTRKPLRVDLWVCAMGGASIDVGYEIPDENGEAALRAMTTIVLVDAATGVPRRLTDDERSGWSAWLDEPPKMRRP